MFKEIEEKWQKAWENARIFEAEPNERQKFFITIPYPYLNGNLHAGHTRTFTIGDAYARYMRMKGYNVLFPLGFHVTGTPIIGLAELIAKRDQRTLEVYTKFHDVPMGDLIGLTTPERIVEYFAKEALNALKRIGYSIDWRRSFTTMDPPYQKFIEWQFWKLKELGYIEKGSHPVRYCPNDQNPVEDHDLLMGEEASIVEFTVIKFRLENSDLIFPCATLRPETIFGVTNIWLKPTNYLIAKVDGEKWVVSKEAFEKLKFMDRDLEFVKEVDGREFIGKRVMVPLVNRLVPILPAEFVDTDNATGVVMSVPAHAPYDYVALRDLNAKIEPIVIISSGNKDVPAKEVVEELKVKDQNDPELEKATKMLYKKEYHTGIMLENTGKFAGMKVSEAKDKVEKELKELKLADVFYEFSEKPVVCRCGTKCVVKLVEDQWFLRYSDEHWKAKVLEHLERMRIIPEYYKEEFRNKIEWLKDKACARRKGLGTKIPWDKEWLIESLSDSTIYMCYYILAKFINSGELKAENITKEFLDYVLLDKGSLELAKSSGLSKETIEKIKGEFQYWYPVDLRSSGKDLVANHLLFYLFHHVALFSEKHLPKAIAVNGYVSLEGQKMSKSKGPLLTMKKALEIYGADVTRLYILHSAEYDSDADWKSREIEGLASNLERFYSLVSDHYSRDPEKITTLDRWLISRFNRAVKEVREAMDKLQTRRAVNYAFFEIMNDVRWYLRRGGKNLSLILDDWIKLLAPFAPHICEELWHLKHSTFVSLESYPEYDPSKIDEHAEKAELYIAKLLEDIKEVMKFVEKPKVVYIHPAEEWKCKAFEIANEKGIGEAMKWLSMQNIDKAEIANFSKKFRSAELIKDEKKIIEENIEFFERELQIKVSLDSSKIPVERKRLAMPGKPAIFVSS
ncbi:MAG: leucine--tRNA ligase [Archaeoglobaceae archaeon]|nr:leucine--tRNA ligase [Archaeoglobaceae archaeon]MDW8127736.1 leucine--tRNA ligase [Archaeoglobaceae archaeon]